MKIKERDLGEIEKMTKDRLGVVFKFILSLEKGFTRIPRDEENQWGTLALESGAFDFWMDPDEIEYTLDDLKDRK